MKKPLTLFLVSLTMFFAACSPGSTPTPSPPTAAHTDLPVFPGAEENKEEDTGVSYYKISNVDIFDVQRFYKQEMPDAGWEFLGAGDLSTNKTGQVYALWFSKGEDIATVEMVLEYSTVNVFIHFE